MAPEPASDFVGRYELRIPGRPDSVAVARLTVAAIANRLPFSVEAIEDLKLAVAEACTICITQAPSIEAIDITCDATGDQLTIAVRDGRYRVRGEAQKHPPLVAVEGEGLGIFLIQALMDSLQYNVDPQVGTELIMSKRVGA